MPSKTPQPETTLKVGELARRTGLSVRALHHYDQIGLLSPSRRTRSGYRLYTGADIARLQRITALRQVGFTLEQIATALDDPGFSARHAIDLVITHARERLGHQRRVLERLESVAACLSRGESFSPDQLIDLIKDLTMFEKYFTPDQLDAIKARGQTLGPDRIQEVEAAWPVLIAQVKDAIGRGLDPAHPDAQTLARRWTALVSEFTGGDKGIAKSVGTMYANEPAAAQRFGLEPAMFEFIAKACKAMKAP